MDICTRRCGGWEKKVEKVPMKETKSFRVAVPSLWPGGPHAYVSPDMEIYDCFTLIDITQGMPDLITILSDPPYLNGDCLVLVDYLTNNDVQVIAVKGIEPCPMKTIKQEGIDVVMGSGSHVTDVIDSFRDEWPELVYSKQL